MRDSSNNNIISYQQIITTPSATECELMNRVVQRREEEDDNSEHNDPLPGVVVVVDSSSALVTAANRTTTTTTSSSAVVKNPLLQFPPPDDYYHRFYWKMVGTLYCTSSSVILGNMLEWLDFGIFGYSETQLSQQLFGGSSQNVGWIMFGIGFLVRPIGAYLLGKLADSYSRKFSFLLSIIGMAFSTAGLSFLPALCNSQSSSQQSPNDNVVVAATIVSKYCVSNTYWTIPFAVLLRVLQGMAAGGAAGNVNVIQSELWCSNASHRAVLVQSVGVNNFSGASASLLAAGLVLTLKYILGETNYAVYGWRLAFLIVIPPTVLASYLTHHNLPESNENELIAKRHNEGHNVDDGGNESSGEIPHYHDDDDRGDTTRSTRAAADHHHPHHHPTPSSLQNDKQLYLGAQSLPSLDANILIASPPPMGLVVSVSIFIQFTIAAYNNLNVYMVQFAQEHYGNDLDGVTDITATSMVLLGKATQICVTLPVARLGDQMGWFWTAAFGGILCSILAIPMMAASHLGGGMWVAWVLVGIVEPAVATLWILTAPLLATSLFPVETRSQWTSMVMATGVAVAGFFPLLLNQLRSSSVYLSGVVLSIVAALGSGGILWIRNGAKMGRIMIHQRPELY